VLRTDLRILIVDTGQRVVAAATHDYGGLPARLARHRAHLASRGGRRRLQPLAGAGPLCLQLCLHARCGNRDLDTARSSDIGQLLPKTFAREG
jgi:hypothetical protein